MVTTAKPKVWLRCTKDGEAYVRVGSGKWERLGPNPISPLAQWGTKRSLLRFSSDEDLLARANRCHARFLGCLRQGIKDFALESGACLAEKKRRTGHGGWVDWLRANFNGSKETAQRYMRVCNHWPLIVAEGWDKTATTLEELLSYIAKPRGNGHVDDDNDVDEPEADVEEQESTTPELITYTNGDTQQQPVVTPTKIAEPPPPNTKLTLIIPADERVVFDTNVQKMMKLWGTADPIATVLAGFYRACVLETECHE